MEQNDSSLDRRQLNTNMRPKTNTIELLESFRFEMSNSIKELSSSWMAVLKGKYFGSDLIAGLTVAAVALPLNIALAITCSLPPVTGFISGLIGGALATIFGSSQLQVTGPSAALAFLVFGITRDFGVVGVAAACIIIGIIQINFGLLRAGKLIRFIPESVLSGFTSGVGLKILDNQFPDFLGFDNSVPDIIAMMHRPAWLHEVSWIAVFCGLFVASVVIAAKNFKKFPSALFGIIVVTTISIKLDWNIAKVGVIPENLFNFSLPIISDFLWLDLLIKTMPIVILASIESLLTATVIDRMTGTKKHFNPNLELLGQGLANLGSGLFGGMPVSAVLVRSSVNVQSGAKTRLASLFHISFILLAAVYLSSYLAQVPLAALAGLLCVVAVRLIDLNTFIHLCQNEKIGAGVFLLTMIGSVTDHLVAGLALGLLIHILYQFFTRGSEMSDVDSQNGNELENIRAVLKGQAELARKPEHFNLSSENHNWLTQIQEKSFVNQSSFVHKKASLIGKVVLGANVHIAPESSIRADEGTPFFIGSNSNIQDGAVLHALKNKWVKVGGEQWAIFIGVNVSVAHQALVHGPCYVGDHTFVGFKAIIHDSVVGSHCYIGMGAIVVGVEIPEGRYVPHGMIIDTDDKAKGLPAVSQAHHNFNKDVVEVNRGLTEAYLKDSKKSKKYGVILRSNVVAPLDKHYPYHSERF